jgi:catechol 2,3-dioxygenase-like lactoylglutathione lyase family enzyme
MDCTGINHVTVLVRDKQRSEKFYVETLGLEPVRLGSSLWIRVGQSFVHVTDSSGEPPVNSFQHLCLEVRGLPAAMKVLAAKGVELFGLDSRLARFPLDPDNLGQNQVFLSDPDGNLIELNDAANSFLHPAVPSSSSTCDL